MRIASDTTAPYNRISIYIYRAHFMQILLIFTSLSYFAWAFSYLAPGYIYSLFMGLLVTNLHLRRM